MSENGYINRLEESRLLNYLPDLYRGGEFICRFLPIFEATWEPLEQQLNHIYAYFDPHLSPAAFLPWLSTWVGLVFNENMPEERQRELLKQGCLAF